MQNFDIIKKTEAKKTFRNEYVIGKFDIQSNSITERFKGQIDPPKDWKVGLIVGASGTGKTTIAKQLFDDYILKPNFGNDSVFEEMPKNASCDDIAKIFILCGFSSAPSWLKPYFVLSNGEKMRVELAYCILSEKKDIVFDEFTSVIDRTIAKTTCCAVNKAIQKTNKRFIAVSCHDDIEAWLEPDWVFRTDNMQQNNSKKNEKNSNVKFTQNPKNNYGIILKDFII